MKIEYPMRVFHGKRGPEFSRQQVRRMAVLCSGPAVSRLDLFDTSEYFGSPIPLQQIPGSNYQGILRTSPASCGDPFICRKNVFLSHIRVLCR